MVILPGATPLTIPVVASTVAIVILLLLQLPPPTPLLSGRVPATHTLPDSGVIAVGVGLTVTAFTAAQPNEFE